MIEIVEEHLNLTTGIRLNITIVYKHRNALLQYPIFKIYGLNIFQTIINRIENNTEYEKIINEIS